MAATSRQERLQSYLDVTERPYIHLLDALRRRPQTIEILAWEVVESNALTDTLAAIRERWSRDATELVLPDAAEDRADLLALANLLVAGIQYLLIRSRTTPVYGASRCAPTRAGHGSGTRRSSLSA